MFQVFLPFKLKIVTMLVLIRLEMGFELPLQFMC